MNAAPPANKLKSIATAIIAAIIANSVNKIILYFLLLYSIKRHVLLANHISRRSKHVSHISRFRGFIFNAHMICLIVTVGYIPFSGSLALSLKNSKNLSCKYKLSVSHGSISVHQVVFVLGIVSLLNNSETSLPHFE